MEDNTGMVRHLFMFLPYDHNFCRFCDSVIVEYNTVDMMYFFNFHSLLIDVNCPKLPTQKWLIYSVKCIIQIEWKRRLGE